MAQRPPLPFVTNDRRTGTGLPRDGWFEHRGRWYPPDRFQVIDGIWFPPDVDPSTVLDPPARPGPSATPVPDRCPGPLTKALSSGLALALIVIAGKAIGRR